MYVAHWWINMPKDLNVYLDIISDMASQLPVSPANLFRLMGCNSEFNSIYITLFQEIKILTHMTHSGV